MTDPVAAITRRARKWCDGLADMVLIQEHSASWHSLLYDGGRHRIALRLDGERSEAALAALNAMAADPCFAIPGHIVAEINIRADGRTAEGMLVSIEALTIAS